MPEKDIPLDEFTHFIRSLEKSGELYLKSHRGFNSQAVKSFKRVSADISG